MFPPFPLLNKSFRTKDHPGGRGNSNSPPGGRFNRGSHIYYVCVDHPRIILYRWDCHNKGMSRIASCTICTLGDSHAELPGSRIFKEVARLAAAPTRPSTNRLYYNRWLRFAHWTARQGNDPLGPTATQIATFCIISLILMAYHLILSKDTGPA